MRRYLGVLAVVFPSIVEAQTVLADIPPVASLVAQVSEGVTEPGMIAGGITDPHGGTLRPSDARALSEAEVIFWVGPGLTPWLQTALDRLAGDAVIVTLADAPGVVQRPFRMEAVFEAHDDHGHEGHAEDDHGHGDHAQDDHDHDHDHGGHDGLDPHLWLDPANARVWVKVIADTLAEADPDNGAVYAANAETTLTRLETLERNIAARLEGRTPRFVMDHDSLGHFENRFGVTALAAVSDGDAARPGPRRIDAVRRAARDRVAVCLLVEPGQSGRTAVEGVEVRQVDPLGLTFTPGPLLYGEVLGAITETLILCEGGTRE